MGNVNFPFIIIIFSLAFAFIGLVLRVLRLLSYPDITDPSPPKAPARKGIFYAFTLGMLPWEKESARLNMLVYLRGVLFHTGVFTGIILLFWSLFVDLKIVTGSFAFSPTLGLGSLAGIIALTARFREPNLHAISRIDDYVSLALVTLVQLIGFAYVLDFASRTLFWGTFSILLLYLPWSKIPHVIYFFFSRTVFGIMVGRRGILPEPKTDHQVSI